MEAREEAREAEKPEREPEKQRSQTTARQQPDKAVSASLCS
jgi:hypothetical protein